ncbi:hypothetical protein Cgig2_020023 [Carnegiea gigantea]|uniref:RNase H type-1 domain-containing protein n=1 Tax=Carnegiea gigantea TaxID=171969 RepID=A0A9Q1KDM3_9CARY|nr:hypothetical protein Cgig2_020023 [Carnegiea gigantea]
MEPEGGSVVVTTVPSKFLTFGDKNSAWFHTRANVRRATNMILEMKDVDGVLYSEMEELDRIIGNFFSSLFSLSSPPEMDQIVELIPCKVGDLIDRDRGSWNVNKLNAVSLPVDVDSVMKILLSWEANVQLRVQPEELPDMWSLPPTGIYKVNFDGTKLGEWGHGWGVVIRDGEVTVPTELGLLIDDILRLCSNFDFHAFSFVRREDNKVAHSLAHLQPYVLYAQVWLEDGPDHIFDLAV